MKYYIYCDVLLYTHKLKGHFHIWKTVSNMDILNGSRSEDQRSKSDLKVRCLINVSLFLSG